MTLDKILGKHYKWWYLIVYNFWSHRAYRLDTIFWSFANFFFVAGPILIWWINFENGAQIDATEIITYLLIGNLFKTLINSWADIDLGRMGQSGNIVPQIVVPTPFIPRMICHYIGASVLGNGPFTLTSVIVVASFVWQYLALPESVWGFVGFLLMIPIGFLIKFLFEFILGSLVFWVVETGGLSGIKNAISDLVQGALIPLFLVTPYLPWIIYQPLAWTFHHPMQIYLGNYDTVGALWTFAGGLLWCVILWVVAKLIFKAGLKKNESVGL